MSMRSIWWVHGHGQAAFGGSSVQLPGAPQLLPGIVVVELQYIPRAGSEWVRFEASDGGIFERPLKEQECELINNALRRMGAEGLRALGFE